MIVYLKLVQWHLFYCIVQSVFWERKVEGLDQLLPPKYFCAWSNCCAWCKMRRLAEKFFLGVHLSPSLWLRTEPGAITEGYFQSFQQRKQFEAMGVFRCKISPLFGFPLFSFPVVMAVHLDPSAKAATCSISWREHLRAENVSLLSSACWNESDTNCSTAYGSAQALWKSPGLLALAAPALQGVKAGAGTQQQTARCWTSASALSLEDVAKCQHYL